MPNHDHTHLDLSAAAATLDVPPGDLDAVVGRARTRTRRRRIAATTVATIAVVASAVGFIGTRGDRDASTNIATQSDGTSAARTGDAGLRWVRADDVTSLAWTPEVAGDGPLYALSTGPGETRFEGTRQRGYVYRSPDGTSWTAATRLGNDLFLSDLAPGDGRVYAVGTGTATARTASNKPVAAPLAGWSDDDGKTWSKVPLTIDMTGIAAKSLGVTIVDTEIATSDAGTVAIAAVQSELDVETLLPAGATAPYGWATTATGVDVLGPPKDDPCPAGSSEPKPRRTSQGEVAPVYCVKDGSREGTPVSPQDAQGVTASYTWEQLHVDGDLLQAAARRPFAFFAPAGTTSFERVELPAVAITAPVSLVHDAAGFDLLGSSSMRNFTGNPPSQVTVIHSADGRHWDAPAAEPGVVWFAGGGVLGGRTALLADGDQGPALLRRNGTGWTRTSLADLVPHGADVTITMSTGGVGPAGAAIAVMEVPDESTFTKENRQDWQPVWHLLTTRDGETWQVQPLDDVAGEHVAGVSGVVVSRDRIVVTFNKPRTDNKAAAAPRLTVVGTPR